MGRGTGGGGASRKSPGRSLHERIAGKAPEALQDFVQTRLTTSPPIVLSTDLFATGYQPAHVALDEPLCPPANQSDDCTDSQGDLATIACLCAQMHLLVEKEAHLAQDPDGLQSELMDTVNQGLERLYSQLQRECMALHPDLQLHESMHVSGMSQMFPVVTERLQLQADPPAKNQVTFKEYLTHISQVHQCLAMAQQLQADLPAGNHKYMAHQIALLYQTLSYSNLKCGAFKKRIEPQFDAIKKVTEACSSPQLPSDLKAWLHEITTDVVRQSTDFSATPLHHISSWLHAVCQETG